MSIMTEIGQLSEDKVLRYGILLVSLIFPGMVKIFINDRQMFFEMDIAHVLLLSIFYSLPFVLTSTLLILVKWHMNKTAFEVNKFIVLFASSAILVSTTMSGVILTLRIIFRWDLNYTTMPIFSGFVIFFAAFVASLVVTERLIRGTKD